MKYKVLILTSGTGSRLGEITKTTNKALVPINGKATISYVIEKYPKDVPFVVTLGYLGEQVKEYLTKNHADRIIEFVDVPLYQGEGSSQNLSTLQAHDNLQWPFIFHACDTIVTEPIPEPEFNWVAGYLHPADFETKQYRTHKIENGKLVTLRDKGVPDFESIHIGLIGVHDYKKYWEVAKRLYETDPMNSTIGDVPVIEQLLKEGVEFKWIPYKVWLDTGNIPALRKTEEYLKSGK